MPRPKAKGPRRRSKKPAAGGPPAPPRDPPPLSATAQLEQAPIDATDPPESRKTQGGLDKSPRQTNQATAENVEIKEDESNRSETITPTANSSRRSMTVLETLPLSHCADAQIARLLGDSPSSEDIGKLVSEMTSTAQAVQAPTSFASANEQIARIFGVHNPSPSQIVAGLEGESEASAVALTDAVEVDRMVTVSAMNAGDSKSAEDISLTAVIPSDAHITVIGEVANTLAKAIISSARTQVVADLSNISVDKSSEVQVDETAVDSNLEHPCQEVTAISTKIGLWPNRNEVHIKEQSRPQDPTDRPKANPGLSTEQCGDAERAKLKDENRRLQRQLEEQRSLVQQVISNIKEDNARVKEGAANWVASMTAIISNLREEVGSVTAERDAALTQISEMETAGSSQIESADINALEQRVAIKHDDYESRISTSQSELAAVKLANSELALELATIKADRDNCRVEYKEAEEQFKQVEIRMHTVQTSLDEANAEVHKCNEAIKNLELENSILVNTKASLESKLEANIKSTPLDTSPITNDALEHEARKDRIIELEEQIHDITKQKCQLEIQVQAASELVEATEQEIKALRRRQVDSTDASGSPSSNSTRDLVNKSRLERAERDSKHNAILVAQLKGELSLRDRQISERQSDVTRLKALIVKQNEMFGTMELVQDKLQIRNRELSDRLHRLQAGTRIIEARSPTRRR